MSLHITNKELEKEVKRLGYKGCKNCQYQIAPILYDNNEYEVVYSNYCPNCGANMRGEEE